MEHTHIQVDNMTVLTMTDCFMSNNTLWHFRTKNEDGEEDGNAVQLDFESATPVYLQHSSGQWLSQHVPEKKARQSSAYFDDMRDVYAGVYPCKYSSPCAWRIASWPRECWMKPIVEAWHAIVPWSKHSFGDGGHASPITTRRLSQSVLLVSAIYHVR